ncbi:hypothetical protein GRX03_03805 [Halovenus sp. WSH3]|uniref:Uncharacterized protein n=1 Tax=Halovenus carboxidivorans TaxID=2692199 RepID=A0A6B0T761_9EURY|nr:hypothetical protein [Halovenus carboxidivorans]MXR50730.1 hypothetical protein [Halovenus carboxidivorans]
MTNSTTRSATRALAGAAVSAVTYRLLGAAGVSKPLAGAVSGGAGILVVSVCCGPRDNPGP